MKIYSPSSREEYSFCPRKWWLRKNGWTSRTIGYPELCAIGGQVVSEAMDAWNKSRLPEFKGLGFIPIEWGEHVHLRIEHEFRLGRTLANQKAHEFLDRLPSLVNDAVSLLHQKDPLKNYTILGSELDFKEAGNSRLDVLVRQGDGRKVVFDYKVKFGEMKQEWLGKTFEQYKNGEQRLTYTALTGSDMFGIILVLMQPTKSGRTLEPRIEMQTWPVLEKEHRTWYREAQLLSSEMDSCLSIPRADLVRGKTYPHENQYGPCGYSNACLRYDLNEEQMKLDYIQIERR